LITGGALALAALPQTNAAQGEIMLTTNTNSFWPDSARLVISISMQMEAGAQPESGAESPLPRIDPKYPDIAATKWYEYGFKEGLPRLLEMFDRCSVKVTSHMVGAAVEKHPALAKEIVQRGHEPAGHGQTWTPQYSMTSEQERKSYGDSAATIERVTGVRPVGFNAFWLRGTPQTLQILQELGYTYYIDDVSRDEPFLVNVRNKPFAVVPYTLQMNDIVNYEGRYFSTDAYAADLKREFDVLYEEGEHSPPHDVGQRARSNCGPPGPHASAGGFHPVCTVPPGGHLHAQGGYRELRDRQHTNRSRGDLGATA
jgi:peptidoglycan/xylan/chitin deacetylase (PgdA/CDA1 family)